MCVNRWKRGHLGPAAAEQVHSPPGELTAGPRLTPGTSGQMMVITVILSPVTSDATSLIRSIFMCGVRVPDPNNLS